MPMPENQSFDLLLRGGQVICPASGLNGVMDVATGPGFGLMLDEALVRRYRSG